MSLHNYRSSSFSEYLSRQPLARRNELLAAEKAYAAKQSMRLVSEQRLFDEQMSGREETPAGPARAREVLAARRDASDWSWKPYRDRVLGESFAELSADALLSRERSYYGIEQPQGTPRATTRVSPMGRITQIHIPPEKQGRQIKTGDCPGDMQSTMKPIWDLISSRVRVRDKKTNGWKWVVSVG